MWLEHREAVTSLRAEVRGRLRIFGVVKFAESLERGKEP